MNSLRVPDRYGQTLHQLGLRVLRVISDVPRLAPVLDNVVGSCVGSAVLYPVSYLFDSLGGQHELLDILVHCLLIVNELEGVQTVSQEVIFQLCKTSADGRRLKIMFVNDPRIFFVRIFSSGLK